MMYYVPSHQLNVQQAQHAQHDSGLPSIKVPNVPQFSWPMSQPTENQQRIHVSINKNYASAPNQPLQTVPSVCNNPWQPGSPLVDAQQFHIRNMWHQVATPTHSIDDDTLYRCNIIEQLRGSYEIETLSGGIQV